ncbi:unique cartilage matrix-associated protein isoform X1 [Gadus macrocephalus]|uniref:unique cartilage matrix-associated protein isoform X2 n=1 Tax=Gadus chalcogrammus TaxID=1042646 RepID=UPI0024C4B5FE|nr:unique cartilage matrix-associated protein isoform X2 [Gadus chalcogrammus]XP_059917702.1 unique cartilage matrix-associated protein isoform X1 [Gadus macrocephalus]
MAVGPSTLSGSSETHLRMSWTHAYLFGVLAVLLALTLWQEAEAAAVSGPRDSAAPGDRPAALRRVFMQGADASHFFRRRSRRAVKSQVETDAEQRQVLAADERRRQFHEAKRARLESHAEEEGDEQDEKSRESTEQWREFHYDGMYPSHQYNPQAP